MASEQEALLGQQQQQQQQQQESAPSSGNSGTFLEEYGSIGVTLVENAEHEPVMQHDFTGPVILEHDTLQRHDSLLSNISETLALEEGDMVASLLPPHDPADLGGQATIPAQIANLSKNIIGCGVLSLSGGIAICANDPAAIISANIWILALGGIFGYFCWLIAKVCHMTGRTTYRGIWQETVGHKGSLAVSIGNMLKAAMADLAYASILSDTLKSLFVAVGLDVPRVACLLLVTLFAILPLCLLKSMHVLAPFSVLGTAGIGLTALALVFRYLDGSYQPGGKFFDDIVDGPQFGDKNGAWGTGILPFVCMVFESYVMHYNSPRFYTELKDRNLQRFGTAVSSSFGLSAIMYCVIASAGFLTFGGNSNSFILNNYSPRDPLATLSRLLVGLSTLMAYPIVFHGARDGVIDILEIPIAEQTPERIQRLTLILLAALTITAIFVTDLGLINAVGGGIIATAIVFVFPTMMFYGAIKQKMGSGNDGKELAFASGLTLFGVIFGVIGAYLAVAGVA